MSKKICFILRTSCGGGAEQVACRLANFYIDRGYEITYCYYYESGSYYLSSQVNTHCFCKTLYKNKINRTINELSCTRTFFRKNSFDDIVILGYSPAIEFVLSTVGLKNAKKAKIIMSERNDPNRNVSSNVQKRLRIWAYNHANIMVFQTDDAKQYFPIGIQKKGEIIPNPIDSDIPEPFSGIRKKTIVTAGRLTEQKNIDLLLDAFLIFCKKHNDYTLQIYGSGVEEERLRKKVDTLGICDRVFFMGFQNNLLEKIKNAAMYVSTSNFEGISNSILEALALGIPTIATDCPIGGNRILIQNLENGILVDPNDKDAIISAMNRIVGDQQFSQTISKQAILVRDTFSIQKIAERWEKLF